MEKVILPEDVQIKKVTISQWDDGTPIEKPIVLFYNGQCLHSDEEISRKLASTHRKCGNCGDIIPQNYYCTLCANREARERYEKLPKKEWDEKNYICDDDGHFFSEWEELFEFLLYGNDEIPSIKGKMLFHTEAQKYEGHLDFYDLWEDILPEEFMDSDIPKEIEKAIETFNQTIDDLNLTASYTKTKVAVLITDEIEKEFIEYAKS
jgi:hypothetical protein